MIKGEIYKGSKVDIWSMGVVLFSMLCGYLPFQDEDNEKLFKKIIKGKFIIPMHVSNQARELLYKLLEINPRKRINISQIKRSSWIKLYCPKEINNYGRIFDIGLNLNKYVIPIDEEIIDELNNEFNLPKDKIRISILSNKSNDYKTLYEILLNKKIISGKKSVADLKSDLFFNYIKDAKNILPNYNNNNVNKKVSERKIRNDTDLNNGKKVNTQLNKKLVKSKKDFFKYDINNVDINSQKYESKQNSNKNQFNNNKNERKNNDIKEIENTFNLNNTKEQNLIKNNTLSQKIKKYEKINNKNFNEKEKPERKNIKAKYKRNNLNTLENNLSTDKNIKKIINDVNYRSEKRRRYQSTDKSNKDEKEIIKLLNNKPKLLLKENKDNQEIDDNKNNLIIEKLNRITKNLLTENEILNLKEKKEENEEKLFNEKILDEKEENFKNKTSNDIFNNQIWTKNYNNEISKSNNYLTANEKINNILATDFISLKNPIKNNINNNFLVENTNAISFNPKKDDNKNNKIREQKKEFYKIKHKSKMSNNKNNLKKHKLKINCDNDFINKISDKRNNSTIKSKTQERISMSEEKRKYFEKGRSGSTPIEKRINLKEIININLVEIKNYINKRRNNSIFNIQRQQKLKIKKYNSIDNEFRHIIKKEDNTNNIIKKYKNRNNKTYYQNRDSKEDLSLIIQNHRRNTMNSIKNKKKFKFKQKSDDLIIHRKNSNKKNKIIFSEERGKNSFFKNNKNNTIELSSLEKKKENKNKKNSLNKSCLIIDKYKSDLNNDNKFIPFDLNCIFISSRKQLKQKVLNICEKMKYKIKFINLYKFNLTPGNKLEPIIEVNISKNPLGILNFKKIRITNLEQTNQLKKIISKINSNF